MNIYEELAIADDSRFDIQPRARAAMREAAALLRECEEVLGALVEAVMDDDPCEAFPIAKHAGRATLAKLSEQG